MHAHMTAATVESPVKLTVHTVLVHLQAQLCRRTHSGTYKTTDFKVWQICHE